MIDLHMHTYYSDGKHSPKYVVEKAHAVGAKMIALTDHDTLDGVPEYLKAAKKYPDIIAFAGSELSLRDMEVLALGIKKPRTLKPEWASYKEAIEAALSMGAVPVLPHAIRTGLRGRVLDKFIAELKSYGLMGVEVFHPEHKQDMADECLALARKHNLLVTAGSDFHEKDELPYEGFDGSRYVGFFGYTNWKSCPELKKTYAFFRKWISEPS